MYLILLVVVLILIFGGGYWGHGNGWFAGPNGGWTPQGYGFGGFGLLLLIVVLFLLFR